MNLKNLITKLGVLFVLLFFAASSTLAQVYVSATNGDDTFGNGSQATPYRTIQKAIDVATSGSTINVEAGIYNSGVLTGEGNPISVAVGKTLTFVGTAVGVNTTVEITNGFTLNHANAIVDMGSSGTAKFNLGSTASALVLTAGTMTIGSANVVLGSGATLEVGNGTLSAIPTKGTNLNVLFNGTNAISSTSAFLPSALGSGTLTINKTSGAITIDNATLSLNTLQLVNAANATLTGDLTVSANGDIVNSSTGTLTIGSSSANVLTMSSTTGAGQLSVTGGGSVVVNSSVTYNVKNAGTSTTAGDSPNLTIGNIFVVTAASNLTINGNVTFNNTNTASSDGKNAVSHNVTLSNAGTGAVSIVGSITTPLSTTTFSNPTGGNNNAFITVVLSNTSTGSFAVRNAALRGATGTNGVVNSGGGSMALGQSGDTFSTGFDVMNDGATAVLTVNAGATFGGAFTNNNAASQVEFGASSSIAGLLDNNGKIKLNSNTLTLSRTGAGNPALDNTGGDIFSSSSGVTGSGVVKFTGATGSMLGNGALPNVEIASGTSFTSAGNVIWGNLIKSGNSAATIGGSSDIKGSLNLNGSGTVTINDGGAVATIVRGDVNMTSGNITLGTAGLTVEGTVNIPQGTFSFGANTLTLKGNFNRTGGTIDATAAGTGTLTFAGTRSQTFTPGTQMNVYNVTVMNSGNFLAGVIEDDIVTVNASLIVLNNFTITTGRVALGTANIRMQQVASARFTNGGRGYTSTGVGGLIFEGSGANPAGPGDGAVIAGTQPYSNIYVRFTAGNDANNVFALGAVKISGVITLDRGGITWNQADDGVDNFTASTLTLDNTLTVPTVVINTSNNHPSPYLVDGADGAAQALAITTVYNLSYTGPANKTIGATDFVTGKVNNLSLIAGSAAKTITFIAGDGTILGNLSVDAGETLQLSNGGARILTASGNSAVHAVNGSVIGGTFRITGNAAALNGGVGTGNTSNVATLVVDPASGGTFTSNGMKELTNLTINQTQLVSTINLNSATATVNTFTNTAGTTNLNMNSTVVAAGGNYLVSAGNVTLTLNGANAGTRTIAGTLTINGGSLTLGSHINVVGVATQTGNGSIILGDFNLTLVSAYTHSGTGTISAGSGQLIAAATAGVTYTFTTAVDIPNFTLNAPGFGIQFVTNGLNVTNTFVHTAGDLDVNSLPLNIQGNVYTFTAGTYTNNGLGANGKVSLQGASLTLTAASNPTYQNLEVNSTGIVTFASSSSTSARTFGVSTSFAHTKGDIVLGINDLELTNVGGADAAYTSAATAGTVTGSTGSNLGEVVFNGANGNGSITPAENYSIQNFKVLSAASKPGANTKVLTVSSNFTLGANFTFSNSARLVLGDGATITRIAGVFDQVPTFGTTVNVNYNPAGALNSDKELPAASNVLNNLTVSGGAPVLVANTTVNGTLFLAGGTLAMGTSPNKILTIVEGGTINRSGGAFATPGSQNVPTVTTYNLVYSGNTAIGAIGAEFKNDASAVTNLTVSMSGNGILLNANRTVGAFTMSPTGTGAANVYFAVGTDAATRTFTVNGATIVNNGIISTMDATVAPSTNASSFVVKGSLAVNGGSFGSLGTDDAAGVDGGLNITFGGAVTQDVTLAGNITIPNITLASTGATAADATVNIAGGNLTITNLITFDNGILNMGNNTLILPNPTGAANLGQAFDRSGVAIGEFGHVVGKISRLALTNDGAAGTNGRFEFPVGTLSGEYRLAVINFKPEYTVGNPVFLIVNHVAESPEGTVGLPLDGGGVTVGSYPDYYWLVTTAPSSLSPTQRFDIEFWATEIGYPFANVEQLRIIRRQDGAAQSNQWVLQGSAGNYANYNVVENSDTTGVLRTTASIGGLIQQGSRYAVGLPADAIQVMVSGKVTYGNTANTPLAGVVVTLDGKTDTTDANGDYSIVGVANGTYTVTASSSAAWGGVTAGDAQLVLFHTINNPALTGIKLDAADVNNSSTVTSADALDILRRDATLISSFAKGDWVFESKQVVVENANVVADLAGLATGDVNASYVPTLAKEVSNVALSADGKLQVNPLKAIEVPVKVTSDMSIGSMSLALTYPKDLVTFEGIVSKAEGLVVKDNEGSIKIAWASLNAINLKAEEAIVTLKFKPTELFKAGSTVNVGLDKANNELTDANGKALNNALLKAASVEGFVPAEFALRQNYPNPFNPTTKFSYDLPVAGSVRLVVFNTLGEEVATLVNEIQNPGAYELNWNAQNLTSGIYLYRIDVKAGEKSFTKTIKMILMK